MPQNKSLEVIGISRTLSVETKDNKLKGENQNLS